MSININLEEDVSLQQLAAAQAEGFSVMRSAHVGNARGYNLAVADMGIPMLLVDHNIAAQHPEEPGDKNYLPGSIVTREAVQPLPIQTVGTLSLQTTVEGGAFLDLLHIDGLQQVFPNTRIFTNTEYLREEEALAANIVAVAKEHRPDLFTRTVESDGKIRHAASSFADLIDSYGILQLNDDPRTGRGVLMPNELDILYNFMVETMRSGRQKQFHLSGPDMQQYIKDPKMRYTLDQLYALVREETAIGATLPEDIDVALVPADQARFVSTKRRVRQLMTIFDWLTYEDRIARERRTFFTSDAAEDTDAREAFLEDAQAKKLFIAQGLGGAVLEASELFVDPKAAPYVSQYDVLEDGLFMPAQNTHMTMRELRNLGKRLDKMRRALTE